MSDRSHPALGALLAAALAIAGPACGNADKTGVILTIDAVAGAPRPEYVVLTWMGPGGFLFRDRRTPSTGSIPAGSGSLGTVFIEVDDRLAGERRAWGHGFTGGARVSEGTAKVTAAAGSRVPATLALQPGTQPDRDKDGVPDGADDCPDVFNPMQNCKAGG